MTKPERLDTVADLYSETASALLRYLNDCRFDESHLTPMFLALALEYAYQPNPRFWRDFDQTILIEAISRHIPDWKAAASVASGASVNLLRELERIVAINAFDEANAEMLMDLPASERPETAFAAFSWIASELARKGLTKQLEFARPDSESCGEKALDALYCLEQAERGVVVERTGTIVAKAYREAIMKRHADHATRRLET